MLKQIIRKEMLEHLLGLRFALACILCLTVILTSLFVRGVDYSQNLDDYHQNVVMDRQDVESIRDPWGLFWRNIRINLKPNPMKIFVQGISDENGGTVLLQGIMPARFVPTDIQNTSVPLFPFVDMVFFVGIIMSLMAVVFGYNAVSGEKENGTLRLLLSYSVPRDTVLLGKWLGGYLTLIIPFLLTILGMAAVLMLQRNIDLDSGQWLRFCIFLLLSLLYLAAVYSLSLWVSSITRKSSTSIIVLVSLWVVLVMALPNLSPYAATLFAKSSSSMDINKARVEIHKDLWEVKLKAKEDAYDKENGFEPGWENKVDWKDPKVKMREQNRTRAFAAWEKETHLELLREYEKLDTRFNNEMAGQVRVGKWIARLSPFSCLALASVELAGEGLGEQERRMKQINDYHQQFISYGYDEIVRRMNYYTSIISLNKRGDPWPTMRKPIPQFTYQPAAIGAYVKPVLLDAGLLICFTILFFMLSFTAFVRYDVR